jgi:putative tricarboxylic transport membrane protein
MKGIPHALSGQSQQTAWWSGLRQILPETTFIVMAAYLWHLAGDFRDVRGDELGPDFWPRLLTILLALTAGVRLVRKVLALRRVAAANTSAQPGFPEAGMPLEVDDGDSEPISRSKAATGIALAIAYVVGVIYLGYLLATVLFLLVFLWLAGKRNWRTIVPVSVIGAFVFTYMFQKIVFVSLPTGVGVFDSVTVWVYRLVGIY